MKQQQSFKIFVVRRYISNLLHCFHSSLITVPTKELGSLCQLTDSVESCGERGRGKLNDSPVKELAGFRASVEISKSGDNIILIFCLSC